MESRIPIPTDNIYKFYALFGLVLFIAAIAIRISVYKNTNELVFSIAPELSALEVLEKPSPVEATKKELLKRQIEVSVAERDTFRELAYYVMIFGTVSMAFGFSMWQHRVQPRQDELLDLQIAKARLELKQTGPVKCSRRRHGRPSD